MNSSKLGSGATFTYNSVVLDLITNIDWAAWKVEAHDSTVLASTAHEFKPGLPSPDKIKIDFLFDDLDTKIQGLYALAASPAIDAFVLTMPIASGASVATTYTGSAFITAFNVTGVTADDLTKASVELQPTGVITPVYGS